MDTIGAEERGAPPGSTGEPPLGEAPEFMADPPGFLARRYERYGPIFQADLLGMPVIFMVGPEAVSFVLDSHMEHFTWRDAWPPALAELLAGTLFMQDGPVHDRVRGLLAPAFHRDTVQQHLAVMNRLAGAHLARWTELGEFAWYDELNKLTAAIFDEAVLGLAPGPTADRVDRLLDLVLAGTFPYADAEAGAIALRRALEARTELLRLLSELAEDRTRQPGMDALSMMAVARDEQGQGLTVAELASQSLLLLFAGHETVTAMLTWLFMELGLHPAMLDCARAEQAQLAGAGGAPTLEQVRQMPYLDQLLQESERLHPPLNTAFRRVIKPFTFHGYSVPAGASVWYSILGTHRLPEIYADPERFDPDRFGAGAEANRPAFSLIGFGGGPRRCLGVEFCTLELKVIAAHVLRGASWDLATNQDLAAVLLPTSHPGDGLRVSVRAR